MAETIALCGAGEEIARALEQYSGCRILRFCDESTSQRPHRLKPVRSFMCAGTGIKLTALAIPF